MDMNGYESGSSAHGFSTVRFIDYEGASLVIAAFTSRRFSLSLPAGQHKESGGRCSAVL